MHKIRSQVFDYFFLMFCFSVGVSFHSIQPLCKKSRGHPPDISDDKITPYLPRRLADRCNPKIIPWHEPEPGYIEHLYISIPPATCTIDGNVPGAYVGWFHFYNIALFPLYTPGASVMTYNLVLVFVSPDIFSHFGSLSCDHGPGDWQWAIVPVVSLGEGACKWVRCVLSTNSVCSHSLWGAFVNGYQDGTGFFRPKRAWVPVLDIAQ